MQTSLVSFRQFSLSQRDARVRAGFTPPSKMAGFTLIELMVSIAIIGVITAIVLVKYSSFDSTVLLKGAAYEIALGIREAQVKSISSLRSDQDSMMTLHYPYGMSFSALPPSSGAEPDRKTYYAFQYPNESVSMQPRFLSSYTKGSFTLDRTMEVVDTCITLSTGAVECMADGITRLDIAFRRPEFNSLFYAMKGVSPYPSGPTTITSAKIKVHSPNNPGNVFVVDISRMGQVSVSKQP